MFRERDSDQVRDEQHFEAQALVAYAHATGFSAYLVAPLAG